MGRGDVKWALILTVGFLLPCARAYAQADVGTEVGPDILGNEIRYKVHPKLAIYPLALATSLAFDATTWQIIQASTAAPAKDLSNLMSHGYYKIELFQMVIMAKRSGTPLKKLVEEREKGKTLRETAGGLNLDYDQVYDQSLELDAKVQGLLPRIMTVSPSETCSEDTGRDISAQCCGEGCTTSSCGSCPRKMFSGAAGP